MFLSIGPSVKCTCVFKTHNFSVCLPTSVARWMKLLTVNLAIFMLCCEILPKNTRVTMANDKSAGVTANDCRGMTAKFWRKEQECTTGNGETINIG